MANAIQYVRCVECKTAYALATWTAGGHCPNPACYDGFSADAHAQVAWIRSRNEQRTAAIQRMRAAGSLPVLGGDADALIAQWLRDNPRPLSSRGGERNTIYEVWHA